MAHKPCDYCNKNTSGDPFYTGEGIILLPQGFEKRVNLRSCRKCYKEHRLWEVNFKQGN